MKPGHVAKEDYEYQRLGMFLCASIGSEVGEKPQRLKGRATIK